MGNQFKTYVPASKTGRSVTRHSPLALGTAAGNTKIWAPVSRASLRQVSKSGQRESVMVEARVESTKTTCCFGFAPCCCWIFWICVAVIAAAIIIFCSHHYGNNQKSEHSTNTNVKRHDRIKLGDGAWIKRVNPTLPPRKQKTTIKIPAPKPSPEIKKRLTGPVKQRTPARRSQTSARKSQTPARRGTTPARRPTVTTPTRRPKLTTPARKPEQKKTYNFPGRSSAIAAGVMANQGKRNINDDDWKRHGGKPGALHLRSRIDGKRYWRRGRGKPKEEVTTAHRDDKNRLTHITGFQEGDSIHFDKRLWRQ